MAERKFRYSINGGDWIEALQEIPYTIPDITEYDTVVVEPIGEAAVELGIPLAISSLQNVSYSLNTGLHQVDASVAFSGEFMTYSLTEAPEGVTINNTSGVITFASTGYPVYSLQPVTVRAENARGYAQVTFLASLLAIYPANFYALRNDGWSADYTNPPTFDPYNNPERVTVWRVGFDSQGAVTEWQDNLIMTQRVRLPYPDHETLDPTRIALSDYVYNGDRIEGGITNTATEESPKPIVNWVTGDRKIVGNTLDLELVAFHRNARGREQVACVEFIVSDGVNTITQKVNTSTISPLSTDVYPVIVYRASIDITALTDNSLITCNAKVYPWFGTVDSIADSTLSSVQREFSPRYYFKDTVSSNTPYVVYVDPTIGNNTSGVVSRDAAAAKLEPCQTISGAIERVRVVLNYIDGVEVRLVEGTHDLVISYITVRRPQTHSAIVITRDPEATKENVIMTFGSGTLRFRFGSGFGGWIRFKGITMNRIGSTQFSGEASPDLLRVEFEDVLFNNGTQTATPWGSSCNGMMNGVDFRPVAVSSSVLGAGASEQRMFRGINVESDGVEGWLVLGSYIKSMNGSLGYGTRTATGSICAYNWFTGLDSASTGFINVGGSADAENVAIIQNIFEFLADNGGTGFRLSADGATGNLTHMVVHHNVITGHFTSGRANVGYNDGAVPRTFKLMSLKGNIYTQLNTKHDVFMMDGTRVDSWAYMYGVGGEGELTRYIDATEGGLGSSFAQAFPGFNGLIGTDKTIPVDIKWVNYAGATLGATGTGDGDYHIAVDSPAKRRVADTVLRYDLGGNPRAATYSSAGCYE